MNTKEVEVTLIKKEVVAVHLPKNEDHWLPLSNLDLCILHPLDFSIFLCYKKPTCKDNWTSMAMVEVLKKALKEALVPYYFLAGEKVPDSIGEHKLHCNNRGVDFTEAFANTELQKLNLNEPDETIGCKLVPKKKNGVLAVQATGFKCGGLMLACTFDHQIVDAYSAGMFLVSWAEIARSKPFSSLPTFNCAMLNPRHPISFDPSLHNLYVPITMFNPSNDPEPSANRFENRICLVKADIINQLQSQASTKESKRTKLESFSALLWKISAKSAKNKGVSKLGIVVDGRTMLSFGDKEKTSLMSSYFGNVLSIPYDSKKIDELIEKPLSWVANEVHGFLEGAKTKEHFLDLIDWVEAHRPVQSLAKVYSSGNKEGPALVVSSGQHFPISKVDFGWGKSAFGSFYFPWGGNVGYVMPIPSPSGKGDWVVYMHMLKRELELIECEAAHVFKPCTSDCLN
ncbi:hypothetical protein RGQ29_018871 [Quercus rubra]|uniref:Uncharacterized protein n=1 Tax=Quercus rubra TaxID=3512 RepID=A0AAN7IVK2_QUERU|nr:hypothetical protein RGQ29_018871 [Quercus rubra]